jgi:hypothetical protein
MHVSNFTTEFKIHGPPALKKFHQLIEITLSFRQIVMSSGNIYLRVGGLHTLHFLAGEAKCKILRKDLGKSKRRL